MRTVELRHSSTSGLVDDHTQSLRKGRAFIPGKHDVTERERCELAIVHPADGRRFTVAAEVVWIGEAGIGLDLVGLGAGEKVGLAAFVGSTDQGELEPVEGEGMALIPVEGEAAELIPVEDEAAELIPVEGEAAELIPVEGEGADLEPLGDAPDEDDEDGDGLDAEGSPRARSLQERVRSYSLRERDERARHGMLSERIALERAFGSSVWDALLSNPMLSVAEVSRIARNGTISRPLVANIVANAAWIASPEVQRALMSNPRCSGPHLERVMRCLSQSDLTRLAKTCPYRPEVRNLAQRFASKKG
jgi:hypothetical protein